MIRMRRTCSIYIFLAFLFLVSSVANFVCTHAQEGVEVYEILTCMEYDALHHVPNGVRDYFEYSYPSVTLWVNMTMTGDENITVLWLSPEGSLAHRGAGSEAYEGTYWQEIISVLPLDGFRDLLGVWSVELWVNDMPLANYSFSVIDKDSETWGLHARIVGLDSPSKVSPDTNFTVSLTVFYRFRSLTVITPGLWNPDDESLIVEDHDELEGEGTKVYGFTVQSPSEPGDYTVDAAVFYLYDDEWFIDEGGLSSFQVTVESGPGLYTLGNALVAVTVLVTVVAVFMIWKRR
jgi:hypothetical protein